MKNLIYTLFTFLVSFATWAQVGIGTPTPSAELDIITTNTGIPALELNPQSAPVGTQTGQIAVIGDKLFLYDGTRGKWLSVESTALQYGKNGDVDNSDFLRFGGDARNGTTSGALMPFDGTIVYATAQNTNGGTQTFGLSINGANAAGAGFTTFNLVAGAFTETTYNIDFDAGDFINVHSERGNGLDDPIVVVWVKWRR